MQREALAKFKQVLQGKPFISHLDTEPFGDDDVEITATLMPASTTTPVLDQTINKLLFHSMMKQAYYSRIAGSWPMPFTSREINHENHAKAGASGRCSRTLSTVEACTRPRKAGHLAADAQPGAERAGMTSARGCWSAATAA
ncbi:hypothetical protein M8494_25190 [Serratia ureilytica]